jgi:hypothetical protein
MLISSVGLTSADPCFDCAGHNEPFALSVHYAEIPVAQAEGDDLAFTACQMNPLETPQLF